MNQMKTINLATTNLAVSELCYGVMKFGTEVCGDDASRLYETFRQAGGNFFDTAHCYAFWSGGLGASERALGQLVRSHGDRANVIIATKGGHPDVSPKYKRPDRYLAPEVIASDLTESLDRLGMDHVDVYLLHRDDTRVSVGEIIDILNVEVRAGRVRQLGASNWTVQRIAQANEYARAHGLTGFCISQPRFSLAVANRPPVMDDLTTRALSETDAAWHAQSQLPVMPFSPTACGYFATGGKAGTETFDNPTSRQRLERASQLAAELRCTITQVALAWLRHQPFPVIPILGTITLEHLHEAIGCLQVKLTPDQVTWLKGE